MSGVPLRAVAESDRPDGSRARGTSTREVTLSADAQHGQPPSPAGSDPVRELAFKRVKAKRDFEGHLVVYVVVNAFLLLIWGWSGAGYFWPGWVLAGWGIGLALNFFEAFVRKPITEADVEREMRRGGLA